MLSLSLPISPVLQEFSSPGEHHQNISDGVYNIKAAPGVYILHLKYENDLCIYRLMLR